MIWIQNGVAVALIAFGLFLMLTGSIGILRLPDFYSRSHSTGKVDTLGIIVLLAGLAVYEGWTQTGLKLVLGMVFAGLTNPVAVHALAQAARRVGVKPWYPGETGSGASK